MKTILPLDYYYSRNHVWVHVDENIATLGFAPCVSEGIGEIIFIDFPEEDQLFHQNQAAFSVESVRTLFDFVSPISGVVFEVNAALLENPGLLNDDPLGEGWIVRVEMEKESDLLELIRANEYSRSGSELFAGAGNPRSTPGV